MSNTSEKIATVSYVEAMFKRLSNWMPFTRKNGGIMQNNGTLETTNTDEVALGVFNASDIDTLLSVGIGSETEKKNAIKINKTGEIFIIRDITKNNPESLQKILNKQETIICSTYEEMIQYSLEENIGKLIYLTEDSVYNEKTYKSGLYIVSRTKNNTFDLFIVANSVETDLSNYYTKEEVNILIDNVNSGNIDLTNYYTISQIDEKINNIKLDINNLDERLELVEDIIETPISIYDLEGIIGSDLNNDDKIGN